MLTHASCHFNSSVQRVIDTCAGVSDDIHMNQLENRQARYRLNTWMGRTRTDGPNEFEPSKFDGSLIQKTWASSLYISRDGRL